MDIFKQAEERFRAHYAGRLGSVTIEKEEGVPHSAVMVSQRLKPGNYPKIWHHGRKTEDVIVLTHGLTDSPFYVEAIGRRFYNEGVNVIFPLLPAHGLRDPDKAMEDFRLDSKWKEEIDEAVEVASLIGERVSLGGFSTGGTLSLNKVLREPEKIHGCLFLFSAALDLGFAIETATSVPFIQLLSIVIDGKYQGGTDDTYKYPVVTSFAGIELSQVMNENEKLLKKELVSHHVFAAHSVHDKIARVEGVFELLKNKAKNGIAFIIAENVGHAELVLEKDLELKEREYRNPQFDEMMNGAVSFLKKHAPLSVQ